MLATPITSKKYSHVWHFKSSYEAIFLLKRALLRSYKETHILKKNYSILTLRLVSIVQGFTTEESFK